ncbi:MAG TPA: rRNA maturation RNase YbeY [Opitutaceae bacterium]|nr:rRNA maturation RNase YbeY [Opitutaceae bacterium]
MSASARAVSIASRHPRLRLDRAAVVRAIHLLDAHAARFRGGPPPGELSLVFLTDAALARLHGDFLADPSITDVITFAADPAFGAAGEICVSVDAALRQLETARAPRRADSSAFRAELALYVVHGWLHLAGYDDLQPTKKRRMRRAEARAMSLLRAHDAVPRFALAPARSRSHSGRRAR